MTRREFFAGCSATCVAVHVASARATPAAVDAAAAPSTLRQYFAAHTGARFRVYRETVFRDRLRLAEVRHVPARQGLDQFTLIFDGTYRPLLEPGTYDVTAPDGRTLALHLQEAGPNGSRRYAAAFSLLAPPRG